MNNPSPTSRPGDEGKGETIQDALAQAVEANGGCLECSYAFGKVYKYCDACAVNLEQATIKEGSTTLLDCPMCDGKPELIEPARNRMRRYHIRCTECWLLTRSVKSAEEALAAWNRRAGAQEGAGGYDLTAHLHSQREWSIETFGPGYRQGSVIAHIRKELAEIEADPFDLEEWIDVVMLAFDGAWRSGNEPEAIAAAFEAKLLKNQARQWPDWRNATGDDPIEHIRLPDPPKEDER